MKKLKNLALVLSGVVLGVSISLTPEIHAATKLLGGKVAKVVDVKLNGKKIGEGAIISNTTYLPVRAVVNSLNGVEVGTVTSNEVNLVTTSANIVNGNENNASNTDIEKTNSIVQLKNKIDGLKLIIKNTEEELANQIEIVDELKIKADNDKSEAGAQRTQYLGFKKTMENTEKLLEDYKAELADLESQLAELQK